MRQGSLRACDGPKIISTRDAHRTINDLMQTTTVAPAPDSATVDNFTREQLLDACRRLPRHSEAAAAKRATLLLNLAAANVGELSAGDLFVRLGEAMAEAPATDDAAQESGGERRSVLGAELPAEGADDEILSVKDLTLDEVKKQAPPGTSQRCACPRAASPPSHNTTNITVRGCVWCVLAAS